MKCEFSAIIRFVYIRDLSEISREEVGGGGVEIVNLGSEMTLPIPVMGVKFAKPPLSLA